MNRKQTQGHRGQGRTRRREKICPSTGITELSTDKQHSASHQHCHWERTKHPSTHQVQDHASIRLPNSSPQSSTVTRNSSYSLTHWQGQACKSLKKRLLSPQVMTVDCKGPHASHSFSIAKCSKIVATTWHLSPC